jgi:hypothetical protein
MTDIKLLEKQLNSFDAMLRRQALIELNQLTMAGEYAVTLPKEVANMHCHTFYSFNGYGMSPSALAWMAKRDGIKLLGIVDFDVLDAVEEFLDACELLGIRGSAGMETRVFIPQFGTREINSPGEPGISYHMGIGFTDQVLPLEGKTVLDDMRARADKRNRGMVDRLNAFLTPLVLDYDQDVLPLTPAGNATERHMLTALLNASKTQIDQPLDFWADKLSISVEDLRVLYEDLPAFKNKIRSKLMKRGGIGYVQPGKDTFPNVDDVHTLILSGGALPCITWLDGTSDGEKAIEELLDLLIEKGAAALNIVPDRNWNIADSETKALKVQNLYNVVELAKQLDLPLNVGTEMNAFGLKFVDSFEAEELAPVKDAFLDGAYFIYGHTIMQRYAKLGYQSQWADENFATRAEKNDFYTTIGKMVDPKKAREDLANFNAGKSPADILNSIQ